jgi:hypothetical protein
MPLSDYVLDNGLQALKDEADKLYICLSEPANYSEATTGGAKALANKNFGTGNVVTGPADGASGARKVTTVNITNGVETNAGTATAWAIVNSGASRLLATGPISSHAVVGAGTFTLAPFDIILPAAAP